MQSSLSSKSTQNQITLHNFHFYQLLASLSHGLLRECFASVPISAFLSFSIFSSVFLKYQGSSVPKLVSLALTVLALLPSLQSHPLAHSALGMRPSCCLSPTSHMLLPQGIGSCYSFLESSPNNCLSFLSHSSCLC